MNSPKETGTVHSSTVNMLRRLSLTSDDLDAAFKRLVESQVETEKAIDDVSSIVNSSCRDKSPRIPATIPEGIEVFQEFLITPRGGFTP